MPEEERIQISLIYAGLKKKAKEKFSSSIGMKIYAFQYLFNLVNISKYNVIHTNCGISSLAAKQYLQNVDFVGTIHGSYRSEYLLMHKEISQVNPVEEELFQKLDYYAVTCPKKVVTVSSFVDPKLSTISKEKHVILHSGIDTTLFQPKNIKTSPVRIATSGFLEYHKGYDVFLDASLYCKRKGISMRLSCLVPVQK